MSDILIKNIEMPKEGNVYLIIGEDGVVSEPLCFKITSMYHAITKAIELPPHGRLGDLDKLLIRANCIDVFGNPDNTIDRIIQEIEKAPTIIEANSGNQKKLEEISSNSEKAK